MVGTQAGLGEADQFTGGTLTVRRLRDTRGALDQAEVGHGVGQGAGEEVQPPVELLLAQARLASDNGLAELVQHVPVVVGQELA